MIAAIVLAAGASRRMGSPKALLPIGGSTFVARACRALREGGVGRVVVVTRADLADRVRAAVAGGAEVVVNAEPERGMLSSVVAGLDEVGEVSAVLLALVDHPMVRPSTIRALIDRHAADPGRIVVPVAHPPALSVAPVAHPPALSVVPEGGSGQDVALDRDPRPHPGLISRVGRRGHPVLFPASCFGELRAAPLDLGARAVVRRDAARVLEVAVDDPGPFIDVNRPEDLDRLRPG